MNIPTYSSYPIIYSYYGCQVLIPAGENVGNVVSGTLPDKGSVITQLTVRLNKAGVYNITKEETCYIGKRKDPVVFIPGSYDGYDIRAKLPLCLSGDLTNHSYVEYCGVTLGEQFAKMTGFPPHKFIRKGTTSSKCEDLEIGTDNIIIDLGKTNIITCNIRAGSKCRSNEFQYTNTVNILITHTGKICLRNNRTIKSDIYIHMGYYKQF